ncbi:hypothetical protein [Geoalkalibacter subterraneus]|jgi:hypothetical protein|uniref:Uncharacterized protein n=1 Tax=Geoalkalibacter subterraneus TaxID=483547 RepID=A0A0B5FE75_9BACT|nr:hypothetical protein [Geoalkalibacter subterraneus]AJF05573.1 hypothetical protein GSUB_01895 [Geoalkalibacter subterraneus]
MGWIYAFRDSRYDVGIKLGWEKSKYGNKYITIAHSYSPAEIIYEAAWEIETEVKDRSQSNAIEEKASQNLTNLNFPNNGREWFNIDTKSCIEIVSDNLKLKSVKINKLSNNNHDDFRYPKHLDSPRMSKHKQVLWVYEENITKRIKLQRIDEWKTPRETRKRYSRNGFKPIAAFTYQSGVNINSNIKIHRLWETTLTNYKTPIDNSTYGWLPENVSGEEVIHYLAKNHFEQLSPPFNNKPFGVRTSYNIAE